MCLRNCKRGIPWKSKTYVLEAEIDSVEAHMHKCVRLTLYVLKADQKEAVKSIYML